MNAFYAYNWAGGFARLHLAAEKESGVPVKVTPTSKLVAWALAGHWNYQSGRCHPSQRTLAADTGLSLRTVQEGVSVLERIGALTISHGRGNRAAYRLLEACEPARNYDDRNAGQRGADTQDGALPDTRSAARPTRNDEDEPAKVTASRSAASGATQKQLTKIVELASERGVEARAVSTTFEASAEIKRLIALSQSSQDTARRSRTCYLHNRVVVYDCSVCPVCAAAREGVA